MKDELRKLREQLKANDELLRSITSRVEALQKAEDADAAERKRASAADKKKKR
jgi:hypothetical protein